MKSMYKPLEITVVIAGILTTQLNTGHTYWTIADTMDVKNKGKKGKHLNTL
jgi:hypothetical protein